MMAMFSVVTSPYSESTQCPGPEVIKLFPWSTQLSTKFILLINVKMPTMVGILTFISMINTTPERLKAINFFICRYFSFYEQLKFHAQLICLFDLILYIPSTIFQLCSDRLPGLLGLICLAQGHNTVTLVSPEPGALWSRVKRSITKPLRSLVLSMKKVL